MDRARDLSLDRVRTTARRLIGDELCEIAGEPPLLLWQYGSTMIEAVAEKDGSVALRAWLVLGPRVGRETDAVIETFAATLPLGELLIDDEGDLTLEHVIAPGTAPERMEVELRELCRHADRIDDLLQSRVGGQRSVDRLGASVRGTVSMLWPLPEA